MTRSRLHPWLGTLLLSVGMGLVCSDFAAAAQGDDDELEALLAEEREEADKLRRRGLPLEAIGLLKELLRDEPEDSMSRAMRARCRVDLGDWAEAEGDLLRALKDAPEGLDGLKARSYASRHLGELYLSLGRYDEALRFVGAPDVGISPATNGEDAWVLARALTGAGDREGAVDVLRAGAEGSRGQDWQGLLGKARCQQALGQLEAANV
ncbi:MAG: tetratricopeptide repeat protein, partial [Planctomycetes bacterium]|nr:tetratricopeptide repeat protein [Planctomycetota bacterium]